MLFGGAIRTVLVRYFVDHVTDYKRTTFVSGMGRSGTTWLAELLNYHNDYRLIFEPFDHVRVPLAVNFRTHQYLRPSDDDVRFLAPASAILEGLIRGNFVDQHNRKLIADRRLVKDVHANLFLGWLRRHFPEMPIVLLIRHPFAVAVSRVESKADIDLSAQFFSQPELVADYLEPLRDVMMDCATPFERHIAAWCIETGVPLSQLREGEMCLTFYESLCLKPEETLTRIATYLSRPFDRRVLARLKKASHTTLDADRLERQWSAGPAEAALSWANRIAPEQIRRGHEILTACGMEGLYGDDFLPVSDRVVLPRIWQPRRTAA